MLITRSDDERLNERLQASLTWSDDVLIRVTRDSLRAALAARDTLAGQLEEKDKRIETLTRWNNNAARLRDEAEAALEKVVEVTLPLINYIEATPEEEIFVEEWPTIYSRAKAVRAALEREKLLREEKEVYGGRIDCLQEELCAALAAKEKAEAALCRARNAGEGLAHYAQCQVEQFSSGHPQLDMTLFPHLIDKYRAERDSTTPCPHEAEAKRLRDMLSRTEKEVIRLIGELNELRRRAGREG